MLCICPLEYLLQSLHHILRWHKIHLEKHLRGHLINDAVLLVCIMTYQFLSLNCLLPDIIFSLLWNWYNVALESTRDLGETGHGCSVGGVV